MMKNPKPHTREAAIFEELENILDRYFPKGDKRRGQALMLFAGGMVHVKQLLRELGEK